MRKLLGKFFCWLSLHDWYKGMFYMYCTREGCNASIQHTLMDEDIECDDT